jgi:Flp pilus assembly protein TadG
MMHMLSNLRRDERGTSVIELALAAPILGAFLVGMIDLSRAYSYKLQLEQAAQRSIEYIQRNGFNPGDENTIKAEAAAAASVPTSAVIIATWAECTTGTTVTTVSFTNTCSGADSYARYVSVDVQKTHTPFFRVNWNLKTASSNYVLHGKAAIRVQ